MDTDQLIDALIEGSLSPEQASAVEAQIASDSRLRDAYSQQLRMDTALRLLLKGEAEVSCQDFAQGLVARLRSEGAESAQDRDFSKSVLTEILEEKEKIVPLRWPDFVKSAAVAAVAALVVVLGLQMVDLGGSGADDAELADKVSDISQDYLARVQSAQKAVWSKDSSAIRDDGWISEGMIDLHDGVAEIAFNSGARAVVEGPARLSIESDNRTFLEYGKITADVNEQSSGFTVNTPQMNIVDIGTRFGVTVNEAGDTEVHVMEGEVEVSRAWGNTAVTLLREGNAMRSDDRPLSDLAMIPYAGDGYTLTAGEWRDTTPVIVYRFNESGGAQLADSGNRRKGGPYDLSLLGSDLEAQPRRASGIIGRCLVFDQGQTVSTGLSKDFLLEDAFTVSFWIKIPPKVGRRADDRVIGWGSDEASWEIGYRNTYGRGALIVRHGSAYVAGSTDLADGKWHHVAVRYIGGDQTVRPAHIHMYVDGEIERTLDYREGPILSGEVGELRLGDLGSSGFPGWIDELLIFDAAISTKALQEHVSR